MDEERHSSIYDDLVDNKPKKKSNIKLNFSKKNNTDSSQKRKMKFSEIPVIVHVVFIFLLLFFIIPAGLRIVRGFGAWKEYDYMAGRDFIGDPIQHELDPDEELYESTTIDGYTFKIKKLAEYSVAGRVVNVQDFLGYNAFNKFSPRDFGLVYGLYANKENTKGIFFYSLHDRFLHWHINSNNKISELGGINRFLLHVSNNHIIPADKNVRRLMYKVKRNDYIRIDGFLASVYYDNNKRNVTNKSLWTSSTRRNDAGDGACEIIYVTNIVWLKEP